MRNIKVTFLFLALFVVMVWVGAKELYAEIPSNVEVEYSEAVLSYNAKDYPKALQLLEVLEKKSPGLSESLELQALSYKALKEDSKVNETYQKLIKAKEKEGKSASEIAPYHFELGLLRQKEKKTDEAKKHFTYSLENGFNEGVSHLYLGMIAFQAGEWSKSEEHFKGVTSSGTDDLKPVAYFYLGQVYGKLEYPSGATQSFLSARNSAKDILDDKEASQEAKKIARQIYDATEKALAPFDRGQTFGSVGFMAGYDSNLLAIPSSVESSAATGKSSVTNNLQVGVGYASSPLRWIQFVPSYRGAFPFNFNRDSSAAEYLSNDFSLYLTGSPLSRFSYGIKLNMTFAFQNEASESTGRFKYSYYSRASQFGPYLKFAWTPKYVTGLEFSGGPRTYSNDNTGAQKRSGDLNSLRIYLKSEQGKQYWNPTVALKHEGDQSAGSEYRYETDVLEFSNLMHITSLTDVSAGLSSANTRYPDKLSGWRSDKLVSLDMALTHKINTKWTGLASVRLNKNSSTDSDNYSYSRLAMSAGASYTF